MKGTGVLRRSILFGAVVAVAVLLASGPAGAGVGVSLALTMPTGVNVGQEASGSFRVTNTNTVPNQAESNTITQLRLAPSCGSMGTAQNPCPTPDPGVFAVNSPATGAAGTACAGRTFTVSAPDAAGIVTFTTSTPVLLAPPGGPAGTDRCIVNFTFRVLKVPSLDSNPGAAGVQTRANFSGQLTSPSGLVVAASASVEITVARAIPTIATQASPSVQVGGNISDTAIITGVPGIARPTGTVTFQVYGPNNGTCAGAAFAQSTNPITPASPTAGSAVSNQFPVNQAGSYRFVASYSGDANYLPVTSPCGAAGETVNVSSTPVPRRVSDFDGNGASDIAIFRPADGTWYILTPSPMVVQWGQNGDIPVAGDYDGNGTTDIAVFRPGNGAWYIRTPSPIFAVWGQMGDIPVPADYDGNGTTDIAIFRPGTGTWYLRTASPFAVQWGQTGDVPVPADYDGNGTADVAVFRPGNSAWYVRTPSPFFAVWGQAGDIPTPGDYDGNGTADIAVFRPGTGTWYLRTASPFAVQWGQNGDVPVPADYDGNGTTDVAVFRPGNNTWYVRTPTPFARTWGGAGDQPIPLPSAIYRRFFP